MPSSVPQLILTATGDTVRLGFADTPDWFGPGTFAGQSAAVLHSVEEQDDSVVFRIEASVALDGFATGEFARPSFAWPVFDPSARQPGGIPAGSHGFGFQYTEFCWPAHADETLFGWHILPFRPPVVE